ncbi:asparagine-linked glycosylation protein 11-like [Saccoglossus kowalevskii]|uniref:GDP-Man:Man(3)GlcNAc(2)-PP-Dol alpha-1,2-mannosyltransferase n=1 Tax=Saccoglossus kowalevskii TaxID=10224 RepID=A0ABM0GGW0_SACKO|nr:asparagine-linked glycosylation protein 11-like [Saccoglossus kowalevskii]
MSSSIIMLVVWVSIFTSLLISMLVLLLVVGAILIPITVLLFLGMRQWIKQRSMQLIPHLKTPNPDGSIPQIVGFFHPYCNAGGGGERVLWCAINALQSKYKNIKCVVYTGDEDATGPEIIQKARQRFNIVVKKPVEFIFLKRRNWVEATTWPYFTLLGQSLGSLMLGWEGLMQCVPDIYIDSMGYAFTLPMFKYLGGCKVGCYVHYPTISTDMLSRVRERRQTYNNQDVVSQSSVLTSLKVLYYRIFAYVYGVVGARSDIVMVNSTWTHGHIQDLWSVKEKTSIVYPPCDTEDFLRLPLEDDSTKLNHTIVSVAQFRPEKDHRLQLLSFQRLLRSTSETQRDRLTLILVGSCRNQGDAARVDELRQLCEDLKIRSNVEFKLNVSFDELKKYLGEATIGLHTMWNEHFGIGVVECMAAGTVILAHKSGGPKMDIVINYNDKPTGFLANDEESYANAMETILKMPAQQRMEMRKNARKSVVRFSEQEFNDNFLNSVQSLFN